MKLLVDGSASKLERLAKYDFVGGQLITPLTRNKDAGGVFAIDNGAFIRFYRDAFVRLLERCKAGRDRCLFVAMPDVVGSARRTLEAFSHWAEDCGTWPRALVCQDGIEDLPIPWLQLAAVFIGGTNEFKLSKAAADVIKTAQIMGVHSHVGRVNTPDRWKCFEELGVDTCDGSGVSRFDWMLDAIDQMRRDGTHTPLLPTNPESVGGLCLGAGDDGGDSLQSDRAGATPCGSTGVHG